MRAGRDSGKKKRMEMRRARFHFRREKRMEVRRRASLNIGKRKEDGIEKGGRR